MQRKKLLSIKKNGSPLNLSILRNGNKVTVMTERVFEEVKELPKDYNKKNTLLMMVSSVGTYTKDMNEFCDLLKSLCGDKSQSKTSTNGDLKKGPAQIEKDKEED